MVRAVFTLTSFTFAERILGFLFKIYLSREIGAVGMGVYSVALSFFFVLLTLITSGVPLVVSKRTATDRTLGGNICSAALVIELVISLGVCLVALALSNPIGALFADGKSMTLVLIMLPALVFSGIYSSFRGVLWGEEKFTAVSVVELIEQIARIACCVALFFVMQDKLNAVALSMTVACFCSATCCAAIYFCGKRTLKNPKAHFMPLLTASAPITISRTSSSANNYLMAVVVPFLLMSSGLNTDQAMYVFGSCVGMALPLLYLPITVVGSLAFVMIPTLSQAYAVGDKKSMCRQVESALSFSVIIAALVLPAYYALGTPLGTFIYNNTDAGIFLKKSAWLLLPLSFESIASSMLNSLDLEKKSLVNYIIGAVCMYALCFAFFRRFDMDIFMLAFGLSLIVSSTLDVIDIHKRTGFKPTFVKPLAICLVAAYPAYLFTDYVYTLLPGQILPIFAAGIGGVSFSTLAAIIFGAIAFDVNITAKKPRRQSSRG